MLRPIARRLQVKGMHEVRCGVDAVVGIVGFVIAVIIAGVDGQQLSVFVGKTGPWPNGKGLRVI